MTSGVKIDLMVRRKYLDCFLSSACAATMSASAEARAEYEGANISRAGKIPKKQLVWPFSTALLTLHQASSHPNSEGQKVQGEKES